MERLQLSPANATAIIQGFGNVGSYAALELAQQGVKIIGVSDHTACYFDPNGLDVNGLLAYAGQNGALKGYSTEALFDPNQLLVQPCDILVPAAIERVIDADVAAKLKCRILAEAANGPTTPEADAVLDQRRNEIFVIPDILCNSGGVIVSYFEWVQDLQQLFWRRAEVITRLKGLLDDAFGRVMDRVEKDAISNRVAAMAIGVDKVSQAKKTRGLFP
jgi:glutamate dehydrogenase (NAD(P)+)